MNFIGNDLRRGKKLTNIGMAYGAYPLGQMSQWILYLWVPKENNSKQQNITFTP